MNTLVFFSKIVVFPCCEDNQQNKAKCLYFNTRFSLDKTLSTRRSFVNCSEKLTGVKSWGNAGDEEHEPFPTLELILTRLDSSCGFNIEIKYPGMMQTGKMETEVGNPMEMNLFLDQILKTVLSHGKERKILFSSFNPDICTM